VSFFSGLFTILRHNGNRQSSRNCKTFSSWRLTEFEKNESTKGKNVVEDAVPRHRQFQPELVTAAVSKGIITDLVRISAKRAC